AWAHAVAMDADRVAPFLVEHDARLDKRPARLADCLRLGIGCDTLLLIPQIVALIDRVGYPVEVAPRDSGHADPNPDVARPASLLAALRKRVEADGLLGIPPDPEGLRVWDSFLEAWIRLYAASLDGKPGADEAMRELVRQSFGAIADLYCPK